MRRAYIKHTLWTLYIVFEELRHIAELCRKGQFVQHAQQNLHGRTIPFLRSSFERAMHAFGNSPTAPWKGPFADAFGMPWHSTLSTPQSAAKCISDGIYSTGYSAKHTASTVAGSCRLIRFAVHCLQTTSFLLPSTSLLELFVRPLSSQDSSPTCPLVLSEDAT